VNRTGAGFSGYVVAGQSLHQRESQLRGVRNFLIFSALLSLLGALVASWLVAGRSLRPLKRMAAIADAIGGTGDLSRRLPERRARDEVGMLSASFNAMFARLESAQASLHKAYNEVAASLVAQKRFVGDASHELRTPLTTIRNNAGFLLRHPESARSDRDAALQDIASESERMSRLVQDLLTLARADSGFHLQRASVDLAPIAEDVCRQAARVHPQRQVTCRTNCPALVCGNADALRQLIWILLDNAATHTAERGAIRVQLEREGDGIRLSVSDDGRGIAPGEEERIFERFHQADPSRSGEGFGLGLAIARWIVAEHGGTVSASNNVGSGATFVVRLPTSLD
jgi:signal transduction histidine kinase